MSKSVVRIPFSRLQAGDCAAELVAAFKDGGLGAIAVSEVPRFADTRKRLLRMSYQLAHQPDSVLRTLEHPTSLYNAGWSKGKEKIGNVPDELKGSFYANPLHDRVGLFTDSHPFFYPDNIWPTRAMPDLESCFKDLGGTMFGAVILLARQIDSYCATQIESYEKGRLENELRNSKKVKGRLLYYYPPENEAIQEQQRDWIGWHNDSGFLTALTSAMYFDEHTGEEISNPDSSGGLYVVDRNSEESKVVIPADDLVIQCGECLQILTGGLLVATPHSVRPSVDKQTEKKKKRRVGRASFPVFVDSGPLYALSPPSGVSREDVLRRGVSSKVPPLASRWQTGMTFVDFLGTTFKQYYDWEEGKSGHA